MNRSYFIWIWMRYKWIALILVAFNIATVACAVLDLWTPWLYMIPGLTLILWGKADAHKWSTAYEYACRLGNYTTHYAPITGKPLEGHMQAAQYFIRMYPWTSRSVVYKMVPAGKDASHLFLKFSGGGLEWELPASVATKALTKVELSNLMKMSK